MKITLVAALSDNRGIGLRGDLPWRLQDDQRHFMRLTRGHWLVMGRKTFDSIGRKALPRRTNVVISRDPAFRARGVEVARSLEDALERARAAGETEVFVAGGSAIYAEALPIAHRMVLTRVHAEVEADTFFPAVDERAWKLTSETHHAADERNQYAYSIQDWERRAEG